MEQEVDGGAMAAVKASTIEQFRKFYASSKYAAHSTSKLRNGKTGMK